MLKPADRRDVAALALGLALFGFVLGPFLHSLSHTHAHTHAGAPQGSHSGSSLEHFTLATHEAPEPETGLVVRVPARAPTVHEWLEPTLAERHRREQSQGPPSRG